MSRDERGAGGRAHALRDAIPTRIAPGTGPPSGRAAWASTAPLIASGAMITRRIALVALAAAALGLGGTPGHAAPKVPGPRMVPPFIQDDWTKAMALARASKRPVFVEAWAPW